MGRFYFQKHDENCYTLDYHRDYMRDNGLKSLELFEAIRETHSSYFFCKYYFEVGEVGEGCGKSCESYAPRNGKSGRCKHSGHVYEQSEKSITITI